MDHNETPTKGNAMETVKHFWKNHRVISIIMIILVLVLYTQSKDLDNAKVLLQQYTSPHNVTP